jgi:hypothetical protein
MRDAGMLVVTVIEAGFGALIGYRLRRHMKWIPLQAFIMALCSVILVEISLIRLRVVLPMRLDISASFAAFMLTVGPATGVWWKDEVQPFVMRRKR